MSDIMTTSYLIGPASRILEIWTEFNCVYNQLQSYYTEVDIKTNVLLKLLVPFMLFPKVISYNNTVASMRIFSTLGDMNYSY